MAPHNLTISTGSYVIRCGGHSIYDFRFYAYWKACGHTQAVSPIKYNGRQLIESIELMH
jgi:hypothetical protein